MIGHGRFIAPSRRRRPEPSAVDVFVETVSAALTILSAFSAD
ncbi:hypothetical protein HMPREF0185_00243 [Brevundimonas diminuta 470-4]|nr:hypothetical protein HMPREF0185_00243 [Brevundimonas diminuta 470-4]